MKKLFTSLMLGFGAALGVFVALAMPPGGWGVAVGVGLGLLGCLPLLLVLVLLINRGHTDQRRQMSYQEAPQPIIIVQPPAAMPGMAPGYELYGNPAQPAYGYGYLEGPQEYPAYAFEPGYAETVQPRSRRPVAEPRRLSASRRAQAQVQAYEQAYYGPSPEYYAEPEYQPEAYEAYGYYDEAPGQYDEFHYAQPGPDYNDYNYDPPAPERVQPRPRPAARSARSRRPGYEEAVEAQYRMIGDNE